MILPPYLLILLSNLVVIHGISYCCNGENRLDSKKTCLDGQSPKKLVCESSYIIRKDDENAKIEHDESDNLILDGAIIPPNEYCFTNLQSRNLDVYLICDSQTEVDVIKRNVDTYLQLISVLFIILTVIVYFLIPEKLDLQEICIIHSISALALGYLLLSIINLSGHIPDGVCHFLAYSAYFTIMYCFFWLNLVCFHIFRSVVNIRIFNGIKQWKIIYHVYGIGAPLLALGWVMLLNLLKPQALDIIYPGVGRSSCWFETIRESFIFFYGPVIVLLIINIMFFVCTAIEFWRTSRICPKTKVLKYRLKMYCKLCIIMGMTWIFEIISVPFQKGDIRWIWIVTDILNALQGLIIFLILVVFRKKIKRSFANRKIGPFRFPVQWRNDTDSECEELEEVEYSMETRPQTKNDYLLQPSS